MAVVIRLQGLNITAGSQDVRKFFTGLKIPAGGVHIIGGEREEAFIIFASDEDARRAMTRSGGLIQGSSVTLLLSSKTEMQSVLEMSTKRAEMEKEWRPEDNTQGRAFENDMGFSGRSSHPRDQREIKPNDHMYLFLKGLPFSVTEADIVEFFNGLVVDDVILMKKPTGQNNGQALVMFASADDAVEGMKRDKGYIGTRYVEISPTTEKDWLWNAAKRQRATNSGGMEERRGHFDNFRDSQYRDRSPLRPQSGSKEYCVILDNLSYDVEKGDLKKLFWNANLHDDQVLFLVGENGRRTRSAFVLFKTHQDYQEALAKDGVTVLDRWVSVQHISREKMMSLLQGQNSTTRGTVDSRRFQESASLHSGGANGSEKLCLLVLNLPFDVRKVEVMDFFLGFDVKEHNVFLLQDSRGGGAGRALVLFQSDTEARRALCLDGQRFLGSEVMLKCISRSDMGEFGVDPDVDDGALTREKLGDRGGSGAAYDDPVYPEVRRRPATGASYSSRGSDYEPHSRHERDNSRRFNPSTPRYEGPVCVKLLNLPLQIKNEEIYDFCYGYSLIPGSVSLQYNPDGQPQGSATVVFENRQEALTAIDELNGRAIGPRRIQLQFV